VIGVARDDEYGVRDLEFWVDGNAVELADFRRGQFDGNTCTEIPAPNCDPFSRFEGYLNTQGLSDGQHTLQIIATNNHPTSPIPTYYETTFTVDNSCADVVRPNVSLVNPGSGTALQGSVMVEANATDSSGVDRVLYYLDDTYLGLNYESPFQWPWDTTSVADGTHILKAKAVDRCGLSKYSAPVTVTVANSGCADTTPPTVTLTAPGDGATVTGTTTFSATASDASGIEKVVFYVDGSFLRSDTAAPYSTTWDSATVADGSHTLQTRAVDPCGKAAWSNQVQVQTENGQPVTLQFTPTDDTWVSQDEPNRSFGTYNFLRTRTAAGAHGRHVYLKFNVTGIAGPVTSVQLRLRTQETEIPAMGVFRMTNHQWTEESLTWNTASLAQSGYWGDFLNWPGDTWRDLDLPGAVSGNGTYTFGLASSLPRGLMDFWSKESNVYVPVLEVTYTPAAASTEPPPVPK